MRYAESLNPRAYELAACGTFHLSDWRAEVDTVFGGDLPTAQTPAEMTALVRRALAEPTWRADVAARCAALHAGWPLQGADAAGHYAFNDIHALLSMLGAGDLHAAERWLARCAERAMAAADARRDNHAVAREIGLPLARGLVAFARGEPDDSADLLYAARAQAQRLGGSHAQRDLIDQTLFAACARGSRKALGRTLLNERTLAKPATPLTRHWQQALEADSAQARK